MGRYVRVDALDVTQDTPQLWDALGGTNGTINNLIQWWGLPNLESETDLKLLLQEIESSPGCWVNVFRLLQEGQHPPTVAGMACFLNTQSDHGCTEVGYIVHGPALQRTIASTEAHYLSARHIFDHHGYRRYEWKCDSQNAPSRKTALRLGFTYEGTFRQHRVTAKGNNRDTAWFSMLDSEWPERKAAFEAWLDPSNFEEQSGQQKKTLQECHAHQKQIT